MRVLFIPVLRNLSSTTIQCTTIAHPICSANSFPVLQSTSDFVTRITVNNLPQRPPLVTSAAARTGLPRVLLISFSHGGHHRGGGHPRPLRLTGLDQKLTWLEISREGTSLGEAPDRGHAIWSPSLLRDFLCASCFLSLACKLVLYEIINGRRRAPRRHQLHSVGLDARAALPTPRSYVRSTSDGGAAVQPPGLRYAAHWEALGSALRFLPPRSIPCTGPVWS